MQASIIKDFSKYPYLEGLRVEGFEVTLFENFDLEAVFRVDLQRRNLVGRGFGETAEAAALMALQKMVERAQQFEPKTGDTQPASVMLAVWPGQTSMVISMGSVPFDGYEEMIESAGSTYPGLSQLFNRLLDESVLHHPGLYEVSFTAVLEYESGDASVGLYGYNYWAGDASKPIGATLIFSADGDHTFVGNRFKVTALV